MDYKRLQTSYYTNAKEVSYYEHNLTMYDNLPYTRDTDLCSNTYIADHGSQVIQVYRYDTEPYLITVGI